MNFLSHYNIWKIFTLLSNLVINLVNFLDQEENQDQDQTFDNAVILSDHLGGNEGNHTLDQPETPSAETSIGIERLTLEKSEDDDEVDDEV